MDKKFAILENVRKNSDIPINSKIIKNSHQKILNWYVKKFNPYISENINIFHTDGIKIIMPFTDECIIDDKEKVSVITNKTLKYLEENKISIIYCRKDYGIYENNFFYKSTGKYLMPFFIVDNIKRILKNLKKDIRKTEVVIIAQDMLLTEIIIDNIYLDFNFITILMNEENEYDFEPKLYKVFYDSGLNINVTTDSNYILRNADIIINTTDILNKYEYYFKRGAIYIEMAGKDFRTYDLINKRNDLLVIDDFPIKFRDSKFDLSHFELGFVNYSREYRNLIGGRYNFKYTKKIGEVLAKAEVKPANIMHLKSVISQKDFLNFIKYGGHGG